MTEGDEARGDDCGLREPAEEAELDVAELARARAQIEHLARLDARGEREVEQALGRVRAAELREE